MCVASRTCLTGIQTCQESIRQISGHTSKGLKSRRAALGEVLTAPDPTTSAADIARRAKAPSHLGWHLAERAELGVDDALCWLESDEQALREAGVGWIRRLLADADTKVLREVLARTDMSDGLRRTVLANTQPNRATWRVIEARPIDTHVYWSTAPLDVVESEGAVEAIEKLLAHKRPWTAIVVASYCLSDRNDVRQADRGAMVGLMLEALQAAMVTEPGEGDATQMTGYNIGQLLDFLEACEVPDAKLASLEFGYFRLLQHSREPKALNRALANDPHLFVDLLRRVYRGKDEKPTRTDQDGLASQAWWVLHEWHGFPGRRDDGSLDPETTEKWVRQARFELSEIDRTDIGDEVIGQAFAYSPVGDDGVWPCESVRGLIESIGSRELEHGFILGRINSRGFTSRGVFEGGRQERELSTLYRQWAKTVQPTWPRTGRILRTLAESHERDATRQDTEAQIDQDRDW